MASIDDVFAGDSLRAADIKGKEPTVIIQSVEVREFTSKEGKKQSKLAIAFQGAKKTLICNRTNANRIAYMHGKDYTRWPGKEITLFVDPFVEFGGQQTEAITTVGSRPLMSAARRLSPEKMSSMLGIVCSCWVSCS